MRRSLSTARRVMHDFLPNLLTGGRFSVGPPLSASDVAALSVLIEREAPHASIAPARHFFAAAITPTEELLAPIPAEAPAIASLYNLFAIGDPKLRGLGGRLAKRGELEEAVLSQASDLRPPEDPHESLAAHSLVEPALRALRSDTSVRFWAGSAEYPGRSPPARALKLPRLRRVAVRTVDRPAIDVEDPFSCSLLEELFRYSPLTSLVHLQRTTPTFRLEGLACFMTDPWLCRGIVRVWTGDERWRGAAGRLARALMRHLAQQRDKEEVSLWLHVFYHLHVLHLQAEACAGREPPVAGCKSTLANSEDERWQLALFKVLHRGGETFQIPGAKRFGEDIASRLIAYDAAAKAMDTSYEEREIIDGLTSFFNMVGFPGWRRPAPQGVKV